jgi:hypothetical protein
MILLWCGFRHLKQMDPKRNRMSIPISKSHTRNKFLLWCYLNKKGSDGDEQGGAGGCEQRHTTTNLGKVKKTLEGGQWYQMFKCWAVGYCGNKGRRRDQQVDAGVC